MSFENCMVTDVDKSVLFDPSWGTFDMAVGDSIASVSGGSADQNSFPIYAAPLDSANQKKSHSHYQQEMFLLYSELCKTRETQKNQTELIQKIVTLEAVDWLILYEALELVIDNNLDKSVHALLVARLKLEVGESAVLIEQGLQRLSA